MKRILTPALACLLLASLWGCSSSPDAAGQEGTYHVYYSALEDQRATAALGYESYELPQDTSPVLALLRTLFQGPSDQKLTSPFPSGVRLLSWDLEEGCLHLDLSEQYGSLTGIDLTVADACLTLTLCQVEGVESVYVTVEGDEIPYRPIQQLTPSDLLLSNGQEAPPPEEERDTRLGQTA